MQAGSARQIPAGRSNGSHRETFLGGTWPECRELDPTPLAAALSGTAPCSRTDYLQASKQVNKQVNK